MIFKGDDFFKVFRHFSPDTCALKMMMEALRRNGNETAMIEGDTGESVTFSELFNQSTSISAGLHNRGLTAGELVVICCDKSILAYALLLGSMFSGATAVLIPTQGAPDIQKYTRHHPVKAVFCDPVYLESVRKSITKMTHPPSLVATVSTEDQVFTSLMKNSMEYLYEVKDVKKHIPLILFTSGSTGDSKGVPISDLFLLQFGFRDDSKKIILHTAILSWVSSIASMVFGILNAHTFIITESKEPKVLVEIIKKYQVNVWFLAASTANLCIKDPSVHHMALTSLSIVSIGGEALFTRLKKEFIDKILDGRIGVGTMYGSTELGNITTWKYNSSLSFTKENCSGCLFPGAEIKILDDTGEIVGPECVGELWVKTFAMMTGYWSRPELNSQIFDEDGFFRTGDAGYIDNDGYLYVYGRVSDVIAYKGTKISLLEVQDVLLSHPDVLEAAVLVNPHHLATTSLVAFVVIKPDTILTREEIKEYLQGQGDGKGVENIHFIDEIPRTDKNFGKVKRRILQDMLLRKSTNL